MNKQQLVKGFTKFFKDNDLTPYLEQTHGVPDVIQFDKYSKLGMVPNQIKYHLNSLKKNNIKSEDWRRSFEFLKYVGNWIKKQNET